MKNSALDFLSNGIADYVLNPDKYVYPFVIKEKNGKERTIITYNKFGNYGLRLRSAHESIIKAFQINFAQRNKNSYAYHKNVRCYDALQSHLKSNIFIKLDIHNFFESITEELFFSIYGEYFNDEWKKSIQGLFYKGALSIGFVSSPTISDFFMKKFDNDIENYLLDKPELHYSRYSDDILLSTELEGDFSLNELYEFVKKELALFKLEINEKKTRRVALDYEKHNSISFLGLNISKSDYSNNKITISKRYILFLLFLIEKQKKYTDHCYPLDNEIKSRIAYLAYNSPISYQRFQKKHINVYGEPYSFTPKELDKRSAAHVIDQIPNFEEYSKLFKINIHKKVAGSNKDGFAINDAIEIEKYLGSDQDEVEIPYFVDSIGTNAFAHAIRLKKVVLNEKLKNIEDGAFSGCYNLKEINLPKSLRFIGNSAFEGTDIEKIIIPDKIKKICCDTFGRCRHLKEVVLSNNLRTIMPRAFRFAPIESIVFPGSLKEIQEEAFASCCNLKETNLTTSNVEQIGNRAFKGCALLKDAILPNSLLFLGVNAFTGCSSIKRVYIPASVVEIGFLPFSECPLLNSIEVSKDNKVYQHREDNSTIIDNNGLLRFTIKTEIDPDVRTIGYGVFDGSYVKDLVIPEGVTTIGQYAFKDAKWLKSIKLPSTLNIIASSAFAGCISLEEIVLPDGVKTISDHAFEGCYNLKSIKMSNDIETIGDYAFAKCSSLVLDLPKNLKVIGAYAFADCLSIKDLFIPAKVKQIKRDAFKGLGRVLESIKVDPLNTTFSSGIDSNAIFNVKKGILLIGCKNSKVDQGIRVINKYAFAYCDGLKELSLPNTVQTIGAFAFIHCDNLEKIDLNQVNKIEEGAFKSCINLKEINLPNSLTVIKDYAFLGSGINKIVIPESVTTCGKVVFGGCSNLEEISLPSTLTVVDIITNDIFKACHNIKNIKINPKNPNFDTSYECNGLIDKDGVLLLASSSTIIPPNVKRIYSSAFSNNQQLESLVIPETVESIAKDAFKDCHNLRRLEITRLISALPVCMCDGCENLEEVILPVTIENIADSAFNNCKSLKSIVLPGSLKSIGRSAFANTGLEYVVLPSGVEKIGQNAFNGCKELCDINLPDSLSYIGSGAFAGTALKNIVLPENVYVLSSSTFASCKELESVNLNNVTEIGPKAFNNCTKLRKVVMNTKVKMIDSYAFASCEKLTSIKLSNSISFIGSNCFANCISLKKINLPNKLEYIGDNAFENCYELVIPPLPESIISIGKCAFANIKTIKEIFIPKNVNSFDNSAYRGCDIDHIKVDKDNTFLTDEDADLIISYDPNTNKKLVILGCKNSIIPDDVEVICDAAFLKVGKMTHFKLPSALNVIGASAFYETDLGVHEIILPDKLETIHHSAFEKCPNIESVKLNEGLKIIEYNAFSGIHFKKIVLPASLETFNGFDEYDEIEVNKDNKKFASFNNNVLLENGVIIKTLTGAILPPDGSYNSIFANCFAKQKLDRLIIPEGVVSLSGFNGSEINELYLPKSLRRVTDFARNTSIKKIFVDKENPYFTTDDNHTMLFDISKKALYYTANEGIIPEGVSFVSWPAINRKGIHKLSIPSTYISNSFDIDIDIFNEVSVDKNNPIYESRDNAIIRKSDKALMFIANPANIPEGVEIITRDAFAGKRKNHHESIFVPKSVKFIEKNAFSFDCSFGSITVDKDNLIFDSRENSFGIILTNNNIMLAKSLKTVVPDGVILAKYLKEAPRESNPYYPSMCVKASKIRKSTTFTFPGDDLPF